MSLDQVANIASIAASASVVVSLIFIGLQLRQNAHLTRMAAAQTSAQLVSENMGRVIECPDLADILVKSRLNGIESLDPSEMLRISNFLSISFRHYEVLHTHRRYGIFEEELWQGSEARLRDSVTNPAIHDWWNESRPFYARSFADFVDNLIAELKAAEAISPHVE